ncbi:MAG: hypothetical protein AB7Q00_11895 [Phycisphaerales bacterium]
MSHSCPELSLTVGLHGDSLCFGGIAKRRVNTRASFADLTVMWHPDPTGPTPGEMKNARSTSIGDLSRIESLESRVERLQLACMALWEFLQEHHKITNEELNLRIREIDARDGEEDGRASPRARACPSCQRPVSVRHQKCLYCGTEDLEASPFGMAG